MKGVKFTPSEVKYIAGLANIPLTASEEEKLARDFNTTMLVVDDLFKVVVPGIEPTHQVTGLSKVFREDEVDVDRMFTQEEALANARQTHNGFFMVERLIEKEE